MVTAAVGLVSAFGSVGCAIECKDDVLYHIVRPTAGFSNGEYVFPLVASNKPTLSTEECRYYVNNVQIGSNCHQPYRYKHPNGQLDVSNAVVITYDKFLFAFCKSNIESLDTQRTTDLWKGDVSQRVDTALQTLSETFTEQLNGHIQILKSAQDTLKMDINTVDIHLKAAVANAAEQLDLKDNNIKTLLLHMNQSFYEALATKQNASNIHWQEITNQLDARLQQTETRLSVKSEPTLTLPFLMGAFFTGVAGVKISTHWVPLNDAATASGCFVPQSGTFKDEVQR